MLLVVMPRPIPVALPLASLSPVALVPSPPVATMPLPVPLPVAAMAERTDAKVLRFGQGGDVQAIEVQIDEELRPSFVLLSPWGRVAVRLGVRGAHNVSNALAAATAALGLGLSLEQVAVGLESAVTSPLRMDLQQMASGATQGQASCAT